MRNQTLKNNGYTRWKKIGLGVLLIAVCSCAQQPEEQKTTPSQTRTVSSSDLPLPIKAKYIDLDSVAPPIVVPLKGKPKVVPAHPNVHPVGTPKVIPIPKDLTVIAPGKNGVPSPIILPAKTETKPALQPQPTPALAPRFKDEAILNINFLSDEQGLPSAGAALLEDSRGNIWIGGNGATRYDGKNFFHYTEKEGFLKGRVNTITRR